MKRNFFQKFEIVFVVGFVLLLQVGCQGLDHSAKLAGSGQEQIEMAGRPETAVMESEPATDPEPVTRGGGRSGTLPRKTETVSKVKGRGPKISFEKKVHDFGKVAPGSKNECEFKFKNTGDALLKITKVTRTCGCTPYTLAKDEYAPGESGTLKVSYHASTQPGSATKRLYVYINDKANTKIGLTIKAAIVVRIDCEPRRLSLLLNKENAGCPKITLSSTDNKPFAITGFKSTGGSITADVNSAVEATKFVLEPKIDTEKLRKKLNGIINITLTHPECKNVTVNFVTVPRYKINPPSIIVLKAVPEKPIRRRVSILSNYKEDFEIESTSTEKETIKVLGRKKIRSGYQFELQITPPVNDKARVFTDSFFVKIKDGQKLRVTCRGFYPRSRPEHGEEHLATPEEPEESSRSGN